VEYEAAQAIQLAALRTNATVLLFPETVVPMWTAATEAFWKPTLDRLRSSGKIIILGARLPESSGNSEPILGGDYAAALTVLRGGGMPLVSLHTPAHGLAYDNAAVVRGAENAIIQQRIPVPIGMWKPLQPDGARLHLLGPGVIRIANLRVAVLICYEQLLVWPILASLREEPCVIIGMANDHWAAGTSIPRYQHLVMIAWSRLFGLPHLSATNH
jgi:apolipoprotein N-acyltransferase